MNIKSIAKLCGVSVATISRVLNESPNVSEKTRQRVLRIMEAEGYTPNVFARGLGLNTMNMVGIMCSDVANSFYGLAVSLIETNLRAKGYDSLLCCSGSNPESKKKCMKLLLNKRVDAIVLVGSVFREKSDNSYILDAAKQVPVFMINAKLDAPNIYSVYCDEYDAMRSAVHSLFDRGCRRILYLHDTDKWSWAGSQKMGGFLKGLEECGMVNRKELIRLSEKKMEAAKLNIRSAVAAGLEFDAVLVSEDYLAIGALKEFNEQGLNVPIIGFNNSILTTCTTPTISSIDQMLQTLCPAAVDLIEKRLSGIEIPQIVSMPSKLVERETFCSAKDY